MRAVFHDDQRLWLREVEHLPGNMVRRHRRSQRLAARRAGLRIMVGGRIGRRGPAQRLTRMTLLPAGLLSVFLPDGSRRLLIRGGLFSPSLDGGLPLLLLFSPRRRSNSANRPVSTAFSARSNAFSARNAAMTVSLLARAVASSPESVSSGGAIDTLTCTRP
jgi:hypothetical protein